MICSHVPFSPSTPRARTSHRDLKMRASSIRSGQSGKVLRKSDWSLPSDRGGPRNSDSVLSWTQT